MTSTHKHVIRPLTQVLMFRASVLLHSMYNTPLGLVEPSDHLVFSVEPRDGHFARVCSDLCLYILAS